MTKELIFVADPMCSWCWGFSPVISAIERGFGNRAPIRMVMGGLRPGNTKVMDREAKEYIRHHWEQVESATGQPFDFTFFDRGDFIYDTEPSCRAVVTVRELAPGAELAFLERLHRAFYAENSDVTNREFLAGLAAEAGLEKSAFLEAFDGDDMKAATICDFRMARDLGVTGFPTIVAHDDDAGYGYLTMGYRPYDDLAPLLTEWLPEEHPAVAEGPRTR